MKIIETNFNGLKIFKKQTFNDKRGYTRELFLSRSINKKFPFDILTFSKKNVLRGLHLQVKKPQGKFITVLKGKIYDVSVDCRKNSKTFGKYFSILLSEKENNSIFIPEGFAHAHYSYSKDNLIYYQLSNYYKPEYEDGIIWNDKKLKIKWPFKKPLVSKKDSMLKAFSEFKKIYKYL